MASTRTQRILLVILIGAVTYSVIILIFGFFYQQTNSICYAGDKPQTVTDFWDCCYFSLVSFQTIGYGDIFPALPCSKKLLFTESILQTIYLSLFSGLLVYSFIKRPNNIFTTDNYFVRKVNGKFFLSLRVGNKGAEITGCKIIVELLEINDKQIRHRLVTLTKEFSVMETTWYVDFELSPVEEKQGLLKLMQRIVKREPIQLRFLLMGTDCESGTPVTLVKYFKPDRQQFGLDYLHVLNWDKNKFERSPLNWANFNKITSATDQIKSEFEKL